MDAKPSTKEKAFNKKRWTDEQVKVLIILYEQKELLYNTQHVDYTNREKRQQAYNEIASRLRYMRKTITSEEAKSKIESLRRNFVAELNKIRNGFSQGRYVPSVWWFDSMKFLQSFLKKRNKDEEVDVNDAQVEDLYEESEGSERKKRKLSRKAVQHQADLALLNFIETANEQSLNKNSEHSFGEFIAKELEKIQCVDIREEVKWEIQLAIRKGVQQAIQTNTHVSLCGIPTDQINQSEEGDYFVINNIE